MYNRILLAADGSKNAMRAAEEAAKLARLMPEAVIEVLYVVDQGKVREEVMRASNQAELEENRNRRLEPVLELLINRGVQYRSSIIHGDPGPTIVQHAAKHRIDLIVIGSRGLNALQEFVLGSVSHKVVKRASCPVLVVK
ncbi:universal stress protein [Saccharibacillus sp. O16]|nr:universal stress protein [Saccharibacillus sp. O16]